MATLSGSVAPLLRRLADQLEQMGLRQTIGADAYLLPGQDSRQREIAFLKKIASNDDHARLFCSEVAVRLLHSTYIPEGTGKQLFSDTSDLLTEIHNYLSWFIRQTAIANGGGIGFVGGLHLWLCLRTLRPTLYIESGVFTGYSCRLAHDAVPGLEIFGIDISLRNLRPGTPGTFIEGDLLNDGLVARLDQDASEALVFLDDHQPQLPRLVSLTRAGFRQVLLDDVWDSSTLSAGGHIPSPTVVTAEALHRFLANSGSIEYTFKQLHGSGIKSQSVQLGQADKTQAHQLFEDEGALITVFPASYSRAFRSSFQILVRTT